VNFGEEDAVANATTSFAAWLPGYELDECSDDDRVELVVHARVWLNVAAHDRDFQARERFAG